MLATETIVFFSFSYIGLLFAIAYIGDRHAEIGMSLVSNPYIYALSLAVYCTAWTFYGSVGRAATSGLGFLPTYIGPTLVAALGWLVLRKIIRISKIHRITSIADFIASRYGKSTLLGSVVTIIAVLGIIPYISLQLKAIATATWNWRGRNITAIIDSRMWINQLAYMPGRFSMVRAWRSSGIDRARSNMSPKPS